MTGRGMTTPSSQLNLCGGLRNGPRGNRCVIGRLIQQSSDVVNKQRIQDPDDAFLLGMEDRG